MFDELKWNDKSWLSLRIIVRSKHYFCFQDFEQLFWYPSCHFFQPMKGSSRIDWWCQGKDWVLRKCILLGQSSIGAFLPSSFVYQSQCRLKRLQRQEKHKPRSWFQCGRCHRRFRRSSNRAAVQTWCHYTSWNRSWFGKQRWSGPKPPMRLSQQLLKEYLVISWFQQSIITFKQIILIDPGIYQLL